MTADIKNAQLAFGRFYVKRADVGLKNLKRRPVLSAASFSISDETEDTARSQTPHKFLCPTVRLSMGPPESPWRVHGIGFVESITNIKGASCDDDDDKKAASTSKHGLQERSEYNLSLSTKVHSLTRLEHQNAMKSKQFHPTARSPYHPALANSNSKLVCSHLTSILYPSPISFSVPLHTTIKRAQPIYNLSLAAAALLAPVAVRRLQAGVLIRLAVGLALSAPVPAAEAAVPAAGALLEGVGGRCGLVGCWGGEGAGRGGGGEEDNVELHFEVLVVGGSWKGGSEFVVGWKVGKLFVVACWMRRLMLLMPPLLRGKRPYLYSSLSIYPPAQLLFSTQGKYLKLNILPREAIHYARLTVSQCLTLLSPSPLSLPVLRS
ncbi:hypothetical protein V494_05318 [Pseudogymnoascus sp. VKM F-4513 (FW-928)]|nr:hypothetical protein V494_05318 [Pseudogymnoascus sp. VKM F-4513 (FW-928)]